MRLVNIDIALDDILGNFFSELTNGWLSNNRMDTVSIGMIMDPEESKHLETTTIKVDKFWVDFVNLCAEKYENDIQIPYLMRIGTAEENTYQRHITIILLFF